MEGIKLLGGVEDMVDVVYPEWWTIISSLIDENVSAKFDHMTMEALSNKDNANRKQLKWEMDRHKWIQGRDKKSIVAAKKSGQKRHRWFSKKKGKGGKKK